MYMLAAHVAALALMLLAPAVPAAAEEQQGIRGTWWTKGKEARVEIVDCEPADRGLCGRLVWLAKPNDKKGQPLTDRLNPNKGLRSREIVGLQLIEGWRENGANRWKGKIYDPDKGETFNISIALRADRLTLTGCIVWGCESETWVRYRAP
jgi:uncharacterized protein (DUF2147 family)